LIHPETNPHQPSSDTHDTAHAAEDAPTASTRARRLHRLCGSRDPVDKGLHLVGWSFLEKKIENDADCFFGDRSVDADICDDSINQLIHDGLTTSSQMSRRFFALSRVDRKRQRF
jgi:hypothetical protein